MNGETNLQILLKNMQPELLEDTFVFYTSNSLSWQRIGELSPKGLFTEQEGTSLILSQTIADMQGMSYQGRYKCITLNIHSSLDAVGLTAAVASTLTQSNISANVVAAFYHDHIFVNVSDADEAINALNKLTLARVD